MKKILITGEDSYIGGMFTKWVAQWPDDYEVHEISVRDDDWKQVDFSSYDSVFHVAGIVHTKENKDNITLFYKVNRDLTFEIAKKSKNNGVSQFIFMSTMNVYGLDNGIITDKTSLKPKTAYGKSKMEAEQLISKLQDVDFNVVIIRPPMVYGRGSVGNYSLLSKIAKLTPIFPDYNNYRSMIHIDNLTEIIRQLIDDKVPGVYLPQNSKYVKTSDMVKKIAEINNKQMIQTRLFNPVIKIMTNIRLINKVFGNLTYDMDVSEYTKKYRVSNFTESIKRTEKKID